MVWDEYYSGEGDFYGVMLTGSKPTEIFDNILMTPEHFVQGYDVPNKKTYFVNQLFIKFEAWGKFKKVGELTPDGVEFITDHLTKLGVIPFMEFYNRQRRY